MSTTQLRIACTGLFFLLIFFFGFWLNRSGKPYNLFIFTIHKLIALGAVVFLTMTVYNVHQAAPLSPISNFCHRDHCLVLCGNHHYGWFIEHR